MSDYFSEGYAPSRKKFLEHADRIGAALESIELPEKKGPNGESLFVDVAVIGRPQAERVLFNLNGVHGLESYSGAAAQLQLMDSDLVADLPPEVSIVLVHSINPYGWAHRIQRNEELVDLNRNFVDFDQLPESDPWHAQLAELIPRDEMSFSALDNSWAELLEFSDKLGDNKVMHSLLTGQYIEAKALKYGGDKPSWSNRILREIVNKHLASAKKIAFIDWHTGLGDYGQPYELCPWNPASESYAKTAEWWGKEAVERATSGIALPSDDGSGNMEGINGHALDALLDELPEAEIAGGVIEFGTVPFNLIAQASILDLWATIYSDANDKHWPFWKAVLRTFFAPRDPQWEQSVLDHAQTYYERMLRGLYRWQ